MKTSAIALLGSISLATALPTTPAIAAFEMRIPAPSTLPVQPQTTIAVRAPAIADTLSVPYAQHLAPAPLPISTTTSCDIVSTPLSPRADARAATIFKAANLGGQSTFIPANNYCTDMSNIFGGFDGEVRSLSVEEGVKCDFYQERGCDVNDFTGGGMVLEVGFRGRKDVRRRLGRWAGKIASVRCQRL